MTELRITRQQHATFESIRHADASAIFQGHGYRGLYGGLGAKDIHTRKGLKKSQKILDHKGSTELAANLFRATQTEEKVKREKCVASCRPTRRISKSGEQSIQQLEAAKHKRIGNTGKK